MSRPISTIHPTLLEFIMATVNNPSISMTDEEAAQADLDEARGITRRSRTTIEFDNYPDQSGEIVDFSDAELQQWLDEQDA